jgi:YjbE family integral membrane protein
MMFNLETLIAALQVVWVNLLLSGDNAIVIALACRGLPPDRRRMGMVLGAGAAVLMRIIFTVIVVQLLATPFLKIAGSLLLLWVAVKLIADENAANREIAASNRLLQVVWTIALADMVMSLDNVLAIAAIARDNTVMMVFGLLISVPLIVAGATLLMAMLARFPLLVWAGAGLLGWVAGEMFMSDPWLMARLGEENAESFDLPAAAVAATFVVGAGYLLRERKTRIDQA